MTVDARLSGNSRKFHCPLVLGAVGLALVGYGSYMHVTIGDRTLGNCVATGVCDPWDPQWVVAPVVAGAVVVLLAAVLACRR